MRYAAYFLIAWLTALCVTSHAEVVVFDPGHGGTSPGTLAIWQGDTLLMEKWVNLEVSYALLDTLDEQFQIQDHFTRLSDSTVQNVMRAYFADTIGAEVFISIHHNATLTPQPYHQASQVYHCCDALTGTGLPGSEYDNVARQVESGYKLKKKLYYSILEAFQYPAGCAPSVPI